MSNTTNTADHATPGPWFDWESREWLHDPKHLLEGYKDACLIAAAPDLLESLKRVERHRKIGETYVILADWEWDELRAAIAKAEGAS